MDFSELLLHVLNFLAPALWVALLVPLAARIFMKKQAVATAWYAQAAINFIVCLALLGLGLWYFGRDGMMLTYTAMVLGCASSQWLMLRR